MSLYSGGGKRLAKSRGGKRLCAQKRRRAPRVLGLLVLCAALLTGGALCWQRMVPSGAIRTPSRSSLRPLRNSLKTSPQRPRMTIHFS